MGLRQKKSDELNSELFFSLNEINEFYKGFYHELNNILSAIKIYNSLALKAKDPEKVQKYLESSQVACETMSRILWEIKLLIEKGSFEISNIKLSPILNVVNKILGPRLINEDITINIEVDEKILVKGNQILLTVLFMNLIINSVEELNGRSGSINLVCKIENKKLLIEYFDSGKGDSSKVLNFNNSIKSTKSHSRGNGIWICNNVLRQLSGETLTPVENSTHGFHVTFSLFVFQ